MIGLQVDRRLDCLEREEVEQLLGQLREENSRLETEHKQLLAGQTRPDSQSLEERTLGQQRTRLEDRMAILEDHNRQLEAQLERLRQLVHSDPQQQLELGARNVVAAQLATAPPAMLEVSVVSQLYFICSSVQVPKREEAGSGRSSGSFLDSGTSCEGGAGGRGSHTSDSLNLSQHNTETTVRLSRLTEILSLKQFV